MAKTTQQPGDPRAFLDAAAPDPARRADAEALLALFAAETGASATMWGSAIVGFGAYRYRYASGTAGEACRVGFSPRKAEFALYVGVGRPEVAALLPRLGKHKAAKSCLYVKRLADVDEGVLRVIVRAGFAATPEGFVADVPTPSAHD